MKNTGGKVAKAVIRHHTLSRHHFLGWKKSNGRNSKSILLNDSIKVSLESEFDSKYELVRNTGENVDDKMTSIVSTHLHSPNNCRQQARTARHKSKKE
jgi:hypothetical protein